jgi:hypothetical protein
VPSRRPKLFVSAAPKLVAHAAAFTGVLSPVYASGIADGLPHAATNNNQAQRIAAACHHAARSV